MKFKSTIAALVLVGLCISMTTGSENAGVVSRLCEAVKKRPKVLVDDSKPEIVWSDGAMFEIAAEFPPPVQELIQGAQQRMDLTPMLSLVERDPEVPWKDASVTNSPKGAEYRTVKSSDGTVSVTVASVYIDYLRDRYPSAKIRVKAEMRPVVFRMGETLRGGVMPVATGK